MGLLAKCLHVSVTYVRWLSGTKFEYRQPGFNDQPLELSVSWCGKWGSGIIIVSGLITRDVVDPR